MTIISDFLKFSQISFIMFILKFQFNVNIISDSGVIVNFVFNSSSANQLTASMNV